MRKYLSSAPPSLPYLISAKSFLVDEWRACWHVFLLQQALFENLTHVDPGWGLLMEPPGDE